ncbi:pumilio5-like [Dorcoceras hygrometricum]|uniref:Pumilio5-like n=1 Tax=Dorcoceras hygrometricum TaxID=472368 RepID=A0A2Z7B1L6_9LAMI|nr:pumilio5-like [Dorcoceras hygrometricum]
MTWTTQQATNKPSPKGTWGQNPVRRANKQQRYSINKMQMLCMRHRITTGGYDQQGSHRNPRHSSIKSATDRWPLRWPKLNQLEHVNSADDEDQQMKRSLSVEATSCGDSADGLVVDDIIGDVIQSQESAEACQEPLFVRPTSGTGDHFPPSLSPGPHMPTSFRLFRNPSHFGVGSVHSCAPSPLEACQEPLIVRATSGTGDHSPPSLSPEPHMPTSFRLVRPRTTSY